MSGRQLSIQDATYTDLSKAELDALQRVAIARLQGMDIAVSFGLLKCKEQCPRSFVGLWSIAHF